jgi:signal transduction histidine kinase
MNNSQAIPTSAYGVTPRRHEDKDASGLKNFLSAIHPANWFARKKNNSTLRNEATVKEAEIARLKWELLQRNEQLKNITYYQSHMVRRPLANMLGITELIVADSALQQSGEMAELVSLLRISADELDKAIKNNAQSV